MAISMALPHAGCDVVFIDYFNVFSWIIVSLFTMLHSDFIFIFLGSTHIDNKNT